VTAGSPTLPGARRQRLPSDSPAATGRKPGNAPRLTARKPGGNAPE